MTQASAHQRSAGGCTPTRSSIGAPFNPWRKSCGFYPPDIVGRQRDLTDGQKRLYERAVRWAGQNGIFWRGFDSMADGLGKSVRQVKTDMAVLEAKGLIRHSRRRRNSNVYEFLWHSIFEVQQTAFQKSGFKVQDTSLEVQDNVVFEVQPTAPESSPPESFPLNSVRAYNKRIPDYASQQRRSDASSSVMYEQEPESEPPKADGELLLISAQIPP